MTVTTIPLDDFTVLLRRPFELLTNREDAPIGDPRTGEAVYISEAVAGGLLRSTFSLEDEPTELTVKVVGTPTIFPANTRVRLINPKLTAWYNPRGQGKAAKSDATITAERVELSTDDPTMRGGLPAHTGGVAATLIGRNFDERDDTISPKSVDVMFDSEGVFVVNGVTEIRCPAPIPEGLLYNRVELRGLRAYYSLPDARDVGQRSKAQLVLACTSVAPTASTPAAGPGPKPPRPEPKAPDTKPELEPAS